MNQQTKAHLYLLSATILIAFSFYATSKLSGTIDSISLSLYRFVLAFVFLSPLIIFNKNTLLVSIKVIPRAMIVSLFYSLYFIGMFKALEYSNILNIGALYTLVPLVTATICIYLCKERFAYKHLSVYIIGVISTLIVIFRGDINLFITFSLNKGDIIYLFAIIAMAIYPITLKKLYNKNDHPLSLVFATLFGGIIWMYLAITIFNIPLEWGKIQGELIYYMLYVVIATTIITLFLYQKASMILRPKQVMAYIYLNPILVAIISYLFENESLNVSVMCGVLISTLSTIIILRQKNS